MPHSYLKVVGNPEYRCNNRSPRYSVPLCYPCIQIENFLRFQVQDKHNASFFSYVFGKSHLNPNTKVQKITDKSFNNHGLNYNLQLNTSVLASCRHSQRFHKLFFLPSEPTDMRNTVYVEIVFSLFVLFK